MSGSDNQSDSMSEYSEAAFRSDSIPKQKPLDDPGGFAKALEGGDLIERLGWANYAEVDIHVSPSSAETYQKPAEFIKTR